MAKNIAVLFDVLNNGHERCYGHIFQILCGCVGRGFSHAQKNSDASAKDNVPNVSIVAISVYLGSEGGGGGGLLQHFSVTTIMIIHPPPPPSDWESKYKHTKT